MNQQKNKPGRPRAEDQKPMLPAKIIQAYGETGSLEKTAARCGIAPNTVRAILTRNPDDFASAKKALATRMLAVAGDAVEIAGERIEECSSPQAAVVAGIMAQRGTELLDGQPAGVQITVQMLSEIANSSADLRAKLEALKAAPALREPVQPTEDNVTPQPALTPEEREAEER